jgi:hypothetical protein
MMYHCELEKMYQAWQQGNDQYVHDWAYFVQYAARWNKVSYEEMLQTLQQYRWFKQ